MAVGAQRALAWAALLAWGARGMGCAHRPSAFVGRAGVARPSAVPSARAMRGRPHGVDALGSKKKPKRKFRGGMDWDDARLYDEWIKAGAPDEFDFSDAEEVDLDSPPDTTLSLDDEELEEELAEQLLARAAGARQREPTATAGARAPRAAVPSEWAPQDAPDTRRRRVSERARQTEDDAIAAALGATLPRAPPNWPPDVDEEQHGEVSVSERSSARGGQPSAQAASRPPPTPAAALDLMSAAADAEAAEQRYDGTKRYEPGHETSAISMPGWVRVGHAWTRDPDSPPPAPSAPPKHSVACPPSMRAHILARQAGEVAPPRLWPDTHWKAAWATALDEKQHRALRATWANFNVKVALNFPDVPTLSTDTYGAGDEVEASTLSIADEAIMKAEMAFFASGLPSIADATSLELLANPNSRNDKRYVFRGKVCKAMRAHRKRARGVAGERAAAWHGGSARCRPRLLPPPCARAPPCGAPRATRGRPSAVRARDRVAARVTAPHARAQLTERVDDLMFKLRPLSAPNRVALFHTAVAFVNGTHRIIGDGMCAAALQIANASMSVISRSAAYDDLLERLARTFSLSFTGPNVEAGGRAQIVLPSEQRYAGKEMAGARMLRERVLRDGKVLDSGILKVSAFINHQARARSAGRA